MMMNRSVKGLFILIILGIIFFLSIIFLPFILEYLLKPFSLFLWFFLRFFVLSIDQVILWGIAVWILILIFVIRIKGNDIFDEPNINPEENVYLKNLDLWRFYFFAKPHRTVEMKMLKQRLLRMLVSVYASKKRISIDYKVYDSFRDKEIELPERVYSFLFNEEKKKMWLNHRKIIERLSGKEMKDYYKNLEEYLNYLENYLDIDSSERGI